MSWTRGRHALWGGCISVAYRVYRVVIAPVLLRPGEAPPGYWDPTAAPLRYSEQAGSASEGPTGWQATAFVAPFSWRGTFPSFAASGANSVNLISELRDLRDRLVGAPSLAAPRWIVMVDEFPSLELARLGAYGGGVSPHQRARTVKYMNASGVVLKERRWTFDNGQPTAVGGSGVGVEMTYQKVSDLPGYSPSTVPDDVEKVLRDELLPSQVRSLTWSKIDLERSGDPGATQTNGLVNFFEYDFVPPQSQSPPGGEPPTVEQWKQGIRLRAQGVRSGSGGPAGTEPPGPGRRWITHEYFYEDSSKPWEPTATVQHLVPVAERSSSFNEEWLHRPESHIASRIVTTRYTTQTAGSRYYDQLADLEPHELPVRDVFSVSTGRPTPAVGSVSPGTVYPIQRAHFNEDGKLMWAASGLVRSGGTADASDPFVSLELSARGYDGYGDLIWSGSNVRSGDPLQQAIGPSSFRTLADILGPGVYTASAVGELPGFWTDSSASVSTYWPASLTPIPDLDPDRDPTNGRGESFSFYRYVERVLQDTYHPHGLQTSRRQVFMGPKRSDPNVRLTRLYVMPDLLPSLADSSSFFALSTATLVERWYNWHWEVLGPRRRDRQLQGRWNARLDDLGIKFELDLGPSEFSLDFTPDIQPVYWASRLRGEQDIDPPAAWGSDGARVTRGSERIIAGRALRTDASGRPGRLDQLEVVGGVVRNVDAVDFNDLIDLHRMQTLDKTITLSLRDPLGHITHVFRGADDLPAFTTESEDLPRPAEAPSGSRSMVLTKMTHWGESVADIQLPAVDYYFDSREPMDLNESASASGGPYEDFFAVTPEQPRRIERITYDWQRRPVKSESIIRRFDQMSAPSEPETTTVSWLDMAGRVRVRATFGRGIVQLDSFDPAKRTAQGWPIPVEMMYTGGTAAGALDGFDAIARAVLAANAAGVPGQAPRLGAWLTGLTVFQHDVDGSVAIERQYDVLVDSEKPAELPAGPRFTQSLTVRGAQGQVVFSMSSGEEASISQYDPRGTLFSQRTVLRRDPTLADGGPLFVYETNRTDYTSDPAGFPMVVESLRRTRANGGPALDAATNATRTTNWQWHDHRGRLLLDADFGIEAPSVGRVFNRRDYRIAEWTTASEVGMVPSVFGNPLGTRKLTRYEYYPDGQTKRITSPDGSSATSILQMDAEQRPVGKKLLRVEERATGEATPTRTTYHSYFLGRPRSMSRTDPVTSVPDSTVEYGAKVLLRVDSEDEPRLAYEAPTSVKYNDLIGKVWLHRNPNANDPPDYSFFYTVDGRVAERIDRRGVVLRYMYDGLGRIEAVEVGLREWVPGEGSGAWDTQYRAKIPEALQPGTGISSDQVGFVEYKYDDRGRMSDAIAWHRLPEPGDAPISHVRNTFDSRDQLVASAQSLGVLITASTPAVTVPTVRYRWEYVPAISGSSGQLTAGSLRLASITYPAWGTAFERVVNLQHGGDGSIAAQTDWLEKIHSGRRAITTGQLTVGEVASFATFDGAMRISESLAGGRIVQSYLHPGAIQPPPGASPALPGLDEFERPSRHEYVAIADSSGNTLNTLFRADYTYDPMDRRLTTNVTQAAVPGSGSWHLDRDSSMTYDPMGRLATQVVGPPGTPASSVWGAEVGLGPWGNRDQALTSNGPPGSVRERGDLDGGGIGALPGYPRGGRFDGGNILPWQLSTNSSATDEVAGTHAVIAAGRDELAGVAGNAWLHDRDAIKDVTVEYDGAGNIRWDGKYIYHYDAWNRLIQVDRGRRQQEPGNGPWQLISDAFIRAYVYDAFGRVVRTYGPYPDSTSSNGDLRTERYFYDGVRRIQEVVVDPAMNLALALQGPLPEVQQAATANVAMAQAAAEPPTSGSPPVVDEELLPTPVESAQLLAATTSPTSTTSQSGPILEPADARLAREYVWGPGTHGVDELLAQYDGDGDALYILRDAGGDVIAACDLVEVAQGGGAPVLRVPRVVGQWVYDAFGNVVSYDQLHPHEQVKAGHKGLFADRLDAGLATLSPTTGQLEDTPVLVPFADLRYVVRNRTLHPQLGRWQQRDPNGTGQPVLASLSYHGEPVFVSLGGFGLGTHFGDGLNTHEYVGGDPVNAGDPTGLFISLGDVMGGSSWQSDIQSDHTDQVLEAAMGLRGFLTTRLAAFSVSQQVAADWASDWDAHDNDYIQGGVEDDAWVWSEPEEQVGGDLVQARLSPGQERRVRQAANLSNHGSAGHRKGMAAVAIDLMRHKGWNYKDVEITFNRSPKKYSGVRPDVVIRNKKTQALLAVGEYAWSQSFDALNKRIEYLRKLLGNKIKYGKRYR